MANRRKNIPAKLGRPSIYTEEIAETICVRLALGESLIKITAEDAMPGRVTVLRWLQDNPDFRDQYARARNCQADTLAEEALEAGRGANNENANAKRVHIDAIKWYAGKVAPKKYGDRITQELTGKDGNPIEIEQRRVLDVSALSWEQREQLEQLLLTAIKPKEEES